MLGIWFTLQNRVEPHSQLDQLCASSAWCILKKYAVFSQTRMETRPSFAQCIHFIRTDSLHISVLIAYTSCCKPQKAYGAEYAVMNNKPQYKPDPVIFQPCQAFKKFDSEVNYWISNMDERLLGQSLNFVWIMAVPRKNTSRSKKIQSKNKIKMCQILSPN